MEKNDQNVNPKKRQRKENLIEEASSTGSYLWSERDLNDAIMSVCSEDASNISNSMDYDACCLQQLIVPLLYNPGIFYKRPKSGDTRSHGENESLVPQIILQCMKHSQKLKKDRDTYQSIDWLHSTLCDVSKHRRFNENLFESYRILYNQSKTKQLEIQKTLNSKPGGKSIWKYLVNPQTIIKSVYASQIYEQFMQLARKGKGDGISKEPLPPEATSFLKKMQKLAKIQSEVAEVYLFIAIEQIKRMHPPNWNWIHAFLHETNLDENVSVTEEQKKLDKYISESILGTIKEENIGKVPPALLCIVAKTSFPFAKTFIQVLISRAIKNHGEIPNFIAKQATLGAGTTNTSATLPVNFMDTNPKHQFDCCVNALSQLQETSDRMKSLCRDICHICRCSYQVNGGDANIRALEEIASICFGD